MRGASDGQVSKLKSCAPSARPRVAGLDGGAAEMLFERCVRAAQENRAGTAQKGIAEPGDEPAADQRVGHLATLTAPVEPVAFLDHEQPQRDRPPYTHRQPPQTLGRAPPTN